MIDLSDEILCRYLDKELDADTANEVEAALMLDAGARVRLQRMRDADEVLRKAIPQHSVVDDPLVQYIRSDVNKQDPTSVSRTNHSDSHSRWWVALAAGFAGIVIGVLATYQLSSDATIDQTVTYMTESTSKSLATALNTVKSGDALRRDDDNIKLVLSFNAQNGRHCRVFEVSSSKENAEGIACHNDKHWQVVAWDASQGKADGYRTAGGDELVDSVMNRLGGNTVLESADEQKLINNSWR